MIHLWICSALFAFVFADPDVAGEERGGGSESGFHGAIGGSQGEPGENPCSPESNLPPPPEGCRDVLLSEALFFYGVPDGLFEGVAAPSQPIIIAPKYREQVVFVHTPEQPPAQPPIVVPPPQQVSLLYVLTRNAELGQSVIEVPPSPKLDPEVFYVNYMDGKRPFFGQGGGEFVAESLQNRVARKANLLARKLGFSGGIFEQGSGSRYDPRNRFDNRF